MNVSVLNVREFREDLKRSITNNSLFIDILTFAVQYSNIYDLLSELQFFAKDLLHIIMSYVNDEINMKYTIDATYTFLKITYVLNMDVCFEESKFIFEHFSTDFSGRRGIFRDYVTSVYFPNNILSTNVNPDEICYYEDGTYLIDVHVDNFCHLFAKDNDIDLRIYDEYATSFAKIDSTTYEYNTTSHIKITNIPLLCCVMKIMKIIDEDFYNFRR